MKIGKKILALVVGATMAIGCMFGFAACDDNAADTGDDNIRLVYNMYVENCTANGEEALTYEDWLASIKGEDGEDGKDGVTPHIDSETGNWFIGDEDTHIKAAGTNGSNGSNGTNGKDGSSFLHGTGTPTQDVGKEGDLYLDTTTWHVYEKTAQGWNDLGSIQGPVGPQGPAGPAGGSGSAEGDEWLDGAVTTWSNVTINANDTYDLDVTDVPEGHYWLVAKTETVAAANVLTESYTIESDVIPYDMYSSLTNSFKGFAYISSTATSITLTNKSSANITGDFKLVEYTPVAITIGQEVEIPVPFNKSPTKGNLASYTFDNSLLGQSVKFSFSYFIENGVPSSRYVKSDEGVGSISPAWKAENDQVDGVWSGTRTIPADALRIAFTVTKSEAGCNAVIKIELAEA